MEIYVEPFLYDVESSIKIAKKYNLSLELLVTPDRYSTLQNGRINDDLNNLRGLSIHGPIHNITPGAVDPLAIDLTKRRYFETIEFGIKFKAKWVLFHLSFNPLEFWHPTAEKNWIDRAVNFFNMYLTDPKIKIHLENSFELGPDIFLDILEKFDNDYFSICLDVGHVVAYSKTPIFEWIEKLAPYIKEVHLHNNDGKYDRHWPLDRGVIDIENVLDRLEDNVGNFDLTLEPINTEDLEASLRWLKERSYI